MNLVCADLLIGLQDTETESDRAQRPHVHVRNFSGMDIDAFCTDLEHKEVQNYSDDLDVDLMLDEWSQKFHDVLVVENVCATSRIMWERRTKTAKANRALRAALILSKSQIPGGYELFTILQRGFRWSRGKGYGGCRWYIQ